MPVITSYSIHYTKLYDFLWGKDANDTEDILKQELGERKGRGGKPVGSNEDVSVDIRIISATNKKLEDEVIARNNFV